MQYQSDIVRPDHEVGQLLLSFHGDTHSAIDLLPVLGGGPVLDTHHPDEVKGPSDHHNAAGPLLPDHPPEVWHRGLSGALGHDICLGLDQALKIKGLGVKLNEIRVKSCIITLFQTYVNV